MSDKIKTMVLCGDDWHPARLSREGLNALNNGEFAFDWLEDPCAWSPERMAPYPLLILTRSHHVSATDQTGWMTVDAQAALADYVHRGNGLLAIHSGTAGYDRMTIFRTLLGGVFAHHPDPCPVTLEPHEGHPLCIGSKRFTVTDEHYFMTMEDAQAEVFMITRSQHGEQPGAWRRRAGHGRVAVLTPGHNREVWQHPAFQALLLNTLRWCGKRS